MKKVTLSRVLWIFVDISPFQNQKIVRNKGGSDVNQNMKQGIARFLTLCFLCTLIFSFLYVAKEASHDCTGEHCPICAQIHVIAQTFGHLSAGREPAFIIVPVFAALKDTLHLQPILFYATPVSQKIRMND